MSGMMSESGKIAGVSVVLAIGLGIVSISTTFWVEDDNVGVSDHRGLFVHCMSYRGSHNCSALLSPPGWWQTVQRLAIVHLTVQSLAVPPLVVGLVKQQKPAAFVGSAMSAIAAILLVAANASFTDKQTIGYFGYSFFTSWVASAFSLKAAIWAFRTSVTMPSTVDFVAL